MYTDVSEVLTGLMIEAEHTSETSVDFNETTRRGILEGYVCCHLHRHIYLQLPAVLISITHVLTFQIFQSYLYSGNDAETQCPNNEEEVSQQYYVQGVFNGPHEAGTQYKSPIRMCKLMSM
jgi:hypothetical protein